MADHDESHSDERIFGIAKAELLAGALAVMVGVVTLAEAMRYALGSARNMGPGYFPAALGMLMIVFGLGIALVEGRRAEGGALPHPALRPVLAIMAAILAFALLIERAGLAPAVAAATFLATYAEREVRPVRSAIVACAMAVLTIAVFKFGLGLPFRIVRW